MPNRCRKRGCETAANHEEERSTRALCIAREHA